MANRVLNVENLSIEIPIEISMVLEISKLKVVRFWKCQRPAGVPEY